jgi:DNA-binding transcriptional regulator YbjK
MNDCDNRADGPKEKNVSEAKTVTEAIKHEVPDSKSASCPSRCYSAYVAGLQRAAQIARYYLKHQNLPTDWDLMDDYQKSLQVTSQNIEDAINEEAELPQEQSRFRE